MLRYCNICNCELNGFNSTKKDARRFRKICKTCFREKRNKSRMEKNVVEVNNDIQMILKKKCDPSIKEIHIPEKGFIFCFKNMIKRLFKEI